VLSLCVFRAPPHLSYITPRFGKAEVSKSSATNRSDRHWLIVTIDNLRGGNRQAFVDRFAIEKDASACQKIKTIKHFTDTMGIQRFVVLENAAKFLRFA
jgi:hypothetical protein